MFMFITEVQACLVFHFSIDFGEVKTLGKSMDLRYKLRNVNGYRQESQEWYNITEVGSFIRVSGVEHWLRKVYHWFIVSVRTSATAKTGWN